MNSNRAASEEEFFGVIAINKNCDGYVSMYKQGDQTRALTVFSELDYKNMVTGKTKEKKDHIKKLIELIKKHKTFMQNGASVQLQELVVATHDDYEDYLEELARFSLTKPRYIRLPPGSKNPIEDAIHLSQKSTSAPVQISPAIASQLTPPTGLLSKPWRKLEKNAWTTEANEKLKIEIQTAKLTEEAGVSHINILLIGEVSAGKSSFLNTVESVFTGHVTNRAGAGHGGGSLTTQYRQYKISSKGNEKEPLKFQFCDTMGLESGPEWRVGMSAHDIGKILDGHVQDTTELIARLEPGMPGYNEHPTEEDMIHCLSFVLNANTVSLMDADLVKKMKAIKAEAKSRNLNPIVILTNVDSVCQLTEDNTINVFQSKVVNNKVHEVSDVFGFTLGQIFPVCNYSSETECDDDKDYLALVAMRQILRYSGDYLKDKIARTASMDKILKQNIVAMKKQEQAMKPGNTSDYDEHFEEDEEKEDTGNSSAESVEEEKPRDRTGSWMTNPPGELLDSDCLSSRGNSKQGPPPLLPTQSKKVQAIYNYDPQQEDEVTLCNGEMLDILSEDMDGMTQVKKQDGAVGFVPSNYLGC